MEDKQAIKRLNVVMYNAHKVRPPKSGRYLVVKEYESLEPDIEFDSYSRKHDAFNCTDDMEDSNGCSIDYDWWGEVEELWNGCE